jgi:outer membrane protein OmpA-like peptidoglycan-associated protein
MIRFVRFAFGLPAACSLLFLLSVSSDLHAQTSAETARIDTSKSTFGLFGDAAWNMHRANFQTLPDIPNCCPLFENGSGLGGSFGAFYDYDAFGDGHLGVRLGVNLLDGTLKADEAMTISVNGQAQQGTIEHSIASQFTEWMLQPYYALDLSGFRLLLGADVGSIRKYTFNQAETIISPANEGVFYPSETRMRNVISGDIPQAEKIRFGIIAGLSYPLPLNSSGSMHLIPEVLFDYGLTPMVSGLSWTVSSLQGGVGIGYTPIHVIEPIPIPPPPPPPPPAPALFVGIKAYSIINGVRDSTNLSVSVEEYYSTTLTPLLPFVFFGLDDAHIPARYHSLTAADTVGFQMRPTDTTNNAVDNVVVYHDVLNIIGQRMQQHPRAHITLTGCTSNEPEELADKNLALSRAKAVAGYLENTWSIPASRIIVTSRGLPEKPSSLTQPDGKEENRRVEIAATDPAILAPVLLRDTTLTSDPPMMQFLPQVQSQAGVRRWELYVTTDVMTLHHEFGTGQPKGWDWDLRAVSAKIPRTEDSLEYGLTIDDNAGQEQTTTGTIPVRQVTIKKKREERRADTIIEKYTLVLFDFGSSRIDPVNQRAIEYIHQQLTPGTMAYITGYADRTGEDTLDQRLTDDRANSVAKMLGATNYVAKGVGKSVLLFDNNYPEGRFYSRTVNIVLNKPVNQ